MKAAEFSDSLPRSEIDFSSNVCGLLVFVAAIVLQAVFIDDVGALTAFLAAVSGLPLNDMTVLSLIAILASISTVILIDLVVFRRHIPDLAASGTGLRSKINVGRIATKLSALYAVVLLAWIAYSSFPEYAGEFYDRYFNAVILILPFALVFAAPYFVLVDGKMAEPKDGYYRFGQFLLGLVGGRRNFPYDTRYVYDLGMGWLVKLFFPCRSG